MNLVQGKASQSQDFSKKQRQLSQQMLAQLLTKCIQNIPTPCESFSQYSIMTLVSEILPMLKLKAICSEFGIRLTEEQESQFILFREKLYERNDVMNLTRVSFENCETRHFAESLLILDLIPIGGTVLDMGTGPGFPAAPLAIARPDISVTAIDSNNKMIGFLQEFDLPNVKCINARLEDMGLVEKFDVVTGRAFAPYNIFMEMAVLPCKIGGKILPFRSSTEELQFAFCDELGIKQTGVLMRNVGDGMADRAFPIFEKIIKTPGEYPRPWAKNKASPLGSGTEKSKS